MLMKPSLHYLEGSPRHIYVIDTVENKYTTSQANYPEVSFWEWHRVYVKSHPEAIGVL